MSPPPLRTSLLRPPPWTKPPAVDQPAAVDQPPVNQSPAVTAVDEPADPALNPTPDAVTTARRQER